MRRVQVGPVAGFVGTLVLLGTLAVSVGLGGAGWLVGTACGAFACAALALAMGRQGVVGLGPADRVTLTRTVLACGVAALTADSFSGPVSVPVLVLLSSVALVLDAVDGRLARATGTASSLGARFDMESDAFLILVLSLYVAPSAGWWVLGIGLARYALVGSGWVLPWLRGTLPPRYWCKVVAAAQGIVLTVAASGVLPSRVSTVALVVALALLLESFGREVWGLWLARDPRPDRARTVTLRSLMSTALTVLAGLAVWGALVLPGDLDRLTPVAFLRIPVEGLAFVGVMLLLGARARRPAALLFGALLGLLVILTAFDVGFRQVLDRPFDPVNDWVYLGPGVGVLRDSIGASAAIAVVVGAGLLVTSVLVVLPWSASRLARLVAAHRDTSVKALTALGVVWVVCAVSGLQLAQGAPVASTSAAGVAYGEVALMRANLADRRTFAREISLDPYADTPGDQLLGGLRGKDVLLVFVESYGRVAVQDSSFSPGVDAALDAGTRRLRAAGFSSRSAFLTSPTFGAASWLAHSTLQSGLWVDSQQRYDQLMRERRLTLTEAFGRAGWRTVFDVPANTRDWPEGAAFYGFDQLYDARNVGYRGPSFSYASMPDQYTLTAFRRLELASPDRGPVMAEIDLVSSHHPWTPLPELVPPSAVGDGSVFDGMPEQGESPDVVFRDPDAVRAVYGQSIEYTLRALVSFVTTSPDRDLVLIVLGDHQPHSYVTGSGAGHDVPISVIARDREVVDRIAGWGWQDGLRPRPDAPVWRMDSFRDRFLTAFGPS